MLLVTEGCLGEHVAEDAARDASEEQSRVLAVLLGLEGQSGEALLAESRVLQNRGSEGALHAEDASTFATLALVEALAHKCDALLAGELISVLWVE